MSEADRMRVCPICDVQTTEMMCPTDRVPTVNAAMLEEKWEDKLKPGMMVGGRYEIESFLGAGSMGGVYRGIQVGMNRPVALKTLKQEFLSDAKMLKRFYLEARAISLLDHPNIVRVYDFGVDEEHQVPYIAMEFLAGHDMRTMLFERNRLPEREACYLLSQIAKGLTNAHENGVIHRDLKPANIHIRRLSEGDLHCKVLDFGIAKVLTGDETDASSGLTGTGMAMGTALYMSPEQILGKRLDFRTDLYSLGCMLYECLVGEVPFPGEDVAVLVRHLDAEAPPLPDLLEDGNPPSDGLRRTLTALMAKATSDRPGSTARVARILQGLSHGQCPDLDQYLSTEIPDSSEEDIGTAPHMTRDDMTGSTIEHEAPSTPSCPPSASQTTEAWDTSERREIVQGAAAAPEDGTRAVESFTTVEEARAALHDAQATGDDDEAQSDSARAPSSEDMPRPGSGARSAVAEGAEAPGLPVAPPTSAPADTGVQTQPPRAEKPSRIWQMVAGLVVLGGVVGFYFLSEQAQEIDDRRRMPGVQVQHSTAEAPREEKPAKGEDTLQAILEDDMGPKADHRLAARATRRRGRAEPVEAEPLVRGEGGAIHSIEVNGFLKKEQATTVITEVSETVTNCYGQTQGENGRRLKVKLVILNTGWVMSVEVRPSGDRAFAYRGCVHDTLKALKFPPSKSVGVSAIEIVVKASGKNK